MMNGQMGQVNTLISESRVSCYGCVSRCISIFISICICIFIREMLYNAIECLLG